MQKITRSGALEYFQELRSDEGGILFYKRYAFFLSKDCDAMVTVLGDPLKEVLFERYLEGCMWCNFSRRRLAKLETKMLKQYDNLIFVNRKPIQEMLAGYKVRPKKKGCVSFECRNGTLSITLHIEGEKQTIQSSVSMYGIHRGIHFSDFHFKINAFVLDKIICNGFANCDRIGIKFSAETDIIFFNKNKRYFSKYWAVSPVFQE